MHIEARGHMGAIQYAADDGLRCHVASSFAQECEKLACTNRVLTVENEAPTPLNAVSPR
jgi:hypothetical protein